MKAVVLVGGEGTRLRPLTLNTPKSMVPITNRPFLEHMTEYMKSHGVDDIILTLCYLPDCAQKYFNDGSGFGMRLTYAIEECPLGTAGAVNNVKEHLDESFFVFNGDIFTDINLAEMMEFHLQQGAKATIALTPVEDPTVYGVVETDTEGRVQRFIEKPDPDKVTTNMINAGVYILSPEVLNFIPDGLNYSFEHGLFPFLLERGDLVCGYESDAYWIDIGTPEKYLSLHHDLLMGRITRNIPGEAIADGIWIGEGCDIHRHAKIDGPVIIGRNCVIGSGVIIRGPSVIGQDCRVDADSFIQGSVIWQNTHISQDVSIKECVIAENVVIGERSQLMEGCIVGSNVIVENDMELAQSTQVWPQEYNSSSNGARK